MDRLNRVEYADEAEEQEEARMHEMQKQLIDLLEKKTAPANSESNVQARSKSNQVSNQNSKKTKEP